MRRDCLIIIRVWFVLWVSCRAYGLPNGQQLPDFICPRPDRLDVDV